MIQQAKEFIDKAQKELYKASALQHSISADIKNLLMIKEFAPLVDKFQCGNWITVEVDEELLKLRLIGYDLSYDDGTLSVTVSDVTKAQNGITDLQSVLSQATSMAGSYEAVKSQANKSKETTKYVEDWVNKGIDLTTTRIVNSSNNQTTSSTKNGFLFKEWDDMVDDYSPKQLKIINKGLYVTNDNWETSKAGIGEFSFYNPITQKVEESYGVIADTLVGNLVLSEKVAIYNKNSSVVIGEDGIKVVGAKNSIIIDPNDASLFTITKGIDKVIYFDESGNAVFKGVIQATGFDLIDVAISAENVTGLSSVATSGKYEDLAGAPVISKVAETGNYNDLVNTPTLFSGNYYDLSDLPTLSEVATTGNYSDLYGTPTLSAVATSGKYTDLSNTPTLSKVATTGSYADLSNSPTLSSVATTGKYEDLAGTPDLAPIATSGNYYDIPNRPTLSDVATSGNYADLSGTPVLSSVATSGKYTDLDGTPVLSTVATSGDYSDLANKPNLTVYISKDGVVGSTPSEGATGFYVSSSGLLKASNAVIYGTVTATAGRIGNWTISSGYLLSTSKDASGLTHDTIVSASTDCTNGTNFMIRKTNSDGSYSYPFFVRPNGALHAENADITGKITATSGKIAGFHIAGSATPSNGFWNWALSSVVNTSTTVDASNPQYAVFMRGQSDDGKSGAITPENVVFGVKKRTATSTTWNDASYMFYVKANGVVRCTDFTTTGNAIIFNKLYMTMSDGDKCETLSFDKGDYSLLNIGNGCNGLYFKCKNTILGEAWNSGGSSSWTLYGQVTANGSLDVEEDFAAWSDAKFYGNVRVLNDVKSERIVTNQICLFDGNYDNTIKSAIRYVEGTSDGIGISIGAGGLVVIGSGESASGFIDEEALEGQNEQIWMTADNSIYFVTGCKDYAATKTLTFTDTGIIRPTVNQGWAVGSSTYRFTNGYFTTVYNSSGSITNSDVRLKKDFTEIPNSEEFIMSLKPTQYKYIDGDSDRNHWGFIAQEVKESLDNICKTDCGLYIEDVKGEDSKPLSECTYEEKELGLRYEELIAPHIAVTQKHNDEIAQLKAEIAQLKALLNITE